MQPYCEFLLMRQQLKIATRGQDGGFWHSGWLRSRQIANAAQKCKRKFFGKYVRMDRETPGKRLATKAKDNETISWDAS